MISALLQIIDNKSVVNNIVKIWRDKAEQGKFEALFSIDQYLLNEEEITQDERELILVVLHDY